MANINLIRAKNTLVIAYDREEEVLKSIPENTPIPFSYKLGRDYTRHCKMFAFFNFCFEHWSEDKYPPMFEIMTEVEQFEWFRKTMTINAGYYKVSLPRTLNADGLNVQIADMQKNDKYGYYELIPSEELQKYFFIEAQSLNYNSMSQDKADMLYRRLVKVAWRDIFNHIGIDNADHQRITLEFTKFMP